MMYWSKPYNSTSDTTNLIVTTESSMTLGEYYNRSAMSEGVQGKRMIKIPAVSDAFQFIKETDLPVAPPF
jgi:hypothetical protein